MLSSLPNEILEDIFSRLSVKCLLCLKCVCTSWLAIISSPYFVRLHLNRSVQTKTNLSLFVRYYDFYRVDFYSIGDFLDPVMIDYHPLDSQSFDLFCGSCDGLICLSYDIDTVFLWNPSTRKSIKLPHTTQFATLSNFMIRWYGYGFCYDNTHNDYKVVRIVVSTDTTEENVNDYEIKVYSLRSNLWHSLEKFHHWPNFEGIKSIASGALFWISGDVEGESLIVSLDLVTEKYRVISNPEYSRPRYGINLDNFEGCLALSCYYDLDALNDMEIWLLKEYGGKNEHWSKFISLTPTNPRMDEVLCYVRPVAYSKCGKKVLLEIDFDRLYWYNIEQKSIEPIMVNFAPFFEVLPCLESLVSLDDRTE